MINWSWSVVDPNNVVNIHVFAEIESVNYTGSLYCVEEKTDNTTARVSKAGEAINILDKLLDAEHDAVNLVKHALKLAAMFVAHALAAKL